ncbi:MAG: hypothetical protein JWN37_397 [Candidatus Nomurabacteria bacterium]|nr:hypothetical protein [Candidatus Nomurabacteria bacterium]
MSMENSMGEAPQNESAEIKLTPEQEAIMELRDNYQLRADYEAWRSNLGLLKKQSPGLVLPHSLLNAFDRLFGIKEKSVGDVMQEDVELEDFTRSRQQGDSEQKAA